MKGHSLERERGSNAHRKKYDVFSNSNIRYGKLFRTDRLRLYSQ